MKTLSRMASVAFAVSLASGTAVALTAAPAAAAPANSCKTLKATSTFTPPVFTANANRTIKTTGNVTGCAPKAKTGGSGKFTSQLKTAKPGNCVTLATGGNVLKGTAKVVWKNKRTTNMKVTVKTGTGAKYNIATITGTVASGLFAGKKVTGQVKFTPKNGTCTTSALKSVSVVSTKAFALV